MPLLSLWKSNAAAIDQFSIVQVVATAGDGSLRDNSECSREIQEYFSQVKSEKLADYIEQCLSSKFESGGLVLQDLVNELGRRLDYKVTNGRYQGTSNVVGFDGIWSSPEGQAIIVEVKTTDAFRISLDTIASYRHRLVANGDLMGDPSILLVVGRQDTGELEAQVRGSRHAWDIRLISVESLVKLVKLKENSADLETGRKIRSVLLPVEYTRLDRLVDVMFTAATDVEASEHGDDIDLVSEKPLEHHHSEKIPGIWQFTEASLLQDTREQIIGAMSLKLKANLIRKSRALYWSANHESRIACTISKRYTKRHSYPYWYAYHPQWDEFLGEAKFGYLVLGCVDAPFAFAIPWRTIHNLTDKLNVTQADHGSYWHIHVVEVASEKYELLLPKQSTNLRIDQYKIDVSTVQAS